LVDLRNPCVSLNGVTGPAGATDGSNPLGGLLGSILGESAAQQKKRIEDATKGANDLTGMVRKKKIEPASSSAAAPVAASVEGGQGKRKLDETTEAATNGKRAKIEDGA